MVKLVHKKSYPYLQLMTTVYVIR